MPFRNILSEDWISLNADLSIVQGFYPGPPQERGPGRRSDGQQRGQQDEAGHQVGLLYTVKKDFRFSRPPAGSHLTQSPWPVQLKKYNFKKIFN